MRSSPANASVIWVPMEAIWTIGAASRPVKNTYMIRSPTSSGPPSTRSPPTRSSARRSRRRCGGEGAGARNGGHRLRDVRKIRWRPSRRRSVPAARRCRPSRCGCRRGSPQPAGDVGVDLAPLPENGTKALEEDGHPATEEDQHGERDGGQLPVEPEEHAERDTAVTNPPTSCTRPVPTRFRIPSASDMMREMSTPVFVESK